MRILNEKPLLARCGERERRAREIVLSALKAGVEAVEPGKLVFKQLKKANAKKFRKIFVVGAGKAGAAMASAAETALPVAGGVVAVPEGAVAGSRLKKIRLVEGSHPLVSDKSVKGGKAILSVAEKAGKNDLLVVLLSGGGSALAEVPRAPLSASELSALSRDLMNRGADIRELNTVRKHLSLIKGGWLAKATKARVLTLAVSDVIGNDLGVIASGPTAPDETTFGQARKIMKGYGSWRESAACRIIGRGLIGAIPETPKPGDALFRRVENRVIASNETAVRAALRFLERNGVEAKRVCRVTGDVQTAAEKFSEMLNKGVSFVAGGETTVRVKGNGVGGRNQELALRTGVALRRPAVFASLGTDGIDGVSKAAGALASNELRKKRGEAIFYLGKSDSNSFFKRFGGKLGGEIITGRTGTNVADLMIGLVY